MQLQKLEKGMPAPITGVKLTQTDPGSLFQVGDTTEAPSSGEFELSWDSGDVSPPYVWSFSEFLDQYNELYEWLIQVQLKLYSHSNPPDKAARMVRFFKICVLFIIFMPFFKICIYILPKWKKMLLILILNIVLYDNFNLQKLAIVVRWVNNHVIIVSVQYRLEHFSLFLMLD